MALVAAGLLVACSDAPRSEGSGAGFVDAAVFDERRLDYLRFATERLVPGSPVNVLAHLTREAIDPGFRVPAGAVPNDAWDDRIAKMAALEDTRDFDALELLNVLLAHRDHPALAPGLADKVEAALLAFKFWYTEPTPAGMLDNSADEEIATRAAMVLDVLLFDLALHTHRDAFGVTHGRSYKKDKMTSLDDDTWNGVKMIFDRSAYPYRSISASDATLLAASRRYRVPEVIRRIARSTGSFVDRERMGLPIDENGPYEENPQAPQGFSYTDPEDLPIWWGMGALTAWPVVPLTLETFERYDLWETTNFRPFAGLRSLTADPKVAQRFAVSVARYLNFGVLNEVDTYTHRTADFMLSSAVDYRKGSFAAQVHTWQATFDANAIVFTNHPFRPLPETLDWSDRNLEQGGYWTGEASIPRAAQAENVGVYIYAPQWPTPNPAPLDYFRWEPYTHAYFPQDHFDEVVQEGNWTFGRLGEGYVGLYSFRPTSWRVYDPTRFATNGMVKPFDLVAEGGADNVWIVECGRAADVGSFEAFRAGLRDAAVVVTSRGPGGANGVSDGFDVEFDSPSRDRVSFGWEAPFVVAGEERAVDGFPRYDNPFTRVEFGARAFEIEYEGFGLSLDFDRPERVATGPR